MRQLGEQAGRHEESNNEEKAATILTLKLAAYPQHPPNVRAREFERNDTHLVSTLAGGLKLHRMSAGATLTRCRPVVQWHISLKICSIARNTSRFFLSLY